MTFEFVGMPGVGKSRLCGQLDECLKSTRDLQIAVRASADQRSVFAQKAGNLLRAQRFAILHPKVAIHATRWLLVKGQISFREFVSKSVNLFSELDIADHAEGSLVSDQAVLQAMWSLRLRSRSAENWQELLRMLSPWLPSAVVYVVVEREENIRRLADRKDGRSLFDFLPANKLEAELDRGSELLNSLLDEWRALGGSGRELRILNERDCDVQAKASSVVAFLQEGKVNFKVED
jgi:hypothetical protein